MEALEKSGSNSHVKSHNTILPPFHLQLHCCYGFVLITIQTHLYIADCFKMTGDAIDLR